MDGTLTVKMWKRIAFSFLLIFTLSQPVVDASMVSDNGKTLCWLLWYKLPAISTFTTVLFRDHFGMLKLQMM